MATAVDVVNAVINTSSTLKDTIPGRFGLLGNEFFGMRGLPGPSGAVG